uniref:HAT C-terminal dimerisation domain-containing protein n=1 Tax=Amphimedon queenslandica TaxID=400682 RepID=A0A1X7USM7_AMPQE
MFLVVILNQIVQPTEAAAPTTKKRRTLGSLLKQHECEIGSVSPTISPEQRIQSEFSKYIDEPRHNVEDDPLKWWKIRCELYPMLTGVARKYLCAPATSTVSDRVFSKSRKIVTPAWCALKPDKVEMLVFLAKNVYRNS